MENTHIENRDLFLAAAQTFFNENACDAVVDLAKKRLAVHPDDMDASMCLCRALMGLGKTEQAMAILMNIRNRHRQWAVIYTWIGDIYNRQGAPLQAAASYNAFLTLVPDSTRAEDVRGKLSRLGYAQTPNLPDHGETYEDVDEILTDFRTLTLAELYIKQGHPEMAMDVLEEIVKREPENEKAARLLQGIRTVMRQSPDDGENNQQREKVIGELNRWLKNIDEIRNNDV